MMIDTRDFGQMDVLEEDIVTFAQPLYGFDDLRKYIFIYEPTISEHFIWLQSVEEKDICFILIDPELVVDSYRPELPEFVKKQLGDEDYMCWLLVVVAEVFEKSTVNLKSPIVVNPTQKRAMQVILEADLPIRHPLIAKEKGRGIC